MAHRETRERERERDRERDRVPGRREEERPARRDQREPRDSGRDGREPPRGLNEFFVDGEGIHREVMQREICKYLGPEAFCRPGTYNGASGYIVTAIRPFTPKMIDDLQALSEDYVAENRDLSRRGREGVPYPQSETSQRFDRNRAHQDSPMMGTQDSQYSVDSYAQAMSGYSSSGTPSGYTSTTGYIPGTNYQASQIQGYPPTSAYPSMPGFPAGSSYSTGANYPPVSGYPTSTGYTAPGFPATVGRQGNMNDPPNYIYDTSGDYTNPSYQYRQQGTYPSAYPSDSRPVNVSESRIGPPRASTGYGYVSSPQESGGRSAANFTYDPAVSGQGRGGFPAPPRGAPTGYDGQPLDGGRRPEYRR